MIWRDVPGFEGKYEVSDTGLVRNWATWSILKPRKANDGAYTVSLSCGNKRRKSFRINRLVAMVYIPNPNGYRFVRYKDNNKENSSVENLYWTKYKQNLMLKKVIPGVIYRNIKNEHLYMVYGFTRHSETQEIMVEYDRVDAEIDSIPWVRPLDLFRKKFESLQKSNKEVLV